MSARAIIFDLDNTLAEAFHPPEPSIAEKFAALLAQRELAIMSAASLDRINTDFLPVLPASPRLENLTLFTANAAQAYSYKDDSWRALYQFGFNDAERGEIRAALEQAVLETGVLHGSEKYGDQFVDYEGYIAFTALGLGAPLDARKAWDPDASKRQRLRAALQEKLPQFDVYIGGATSVDVTPKGINKAFGVRKYAEMFDTEPSALLFIGDALYPGGNDEVVIETGVQTQSVKGPSDTEVVLEGLLKQH